MKARNITTGYYYPTPFESMALSYDVYRYQLEYRAGGGTQLTPKSSHPLPPGWRVIAVSSAQSALNFGYIGACYVKERFGNVISIVFASRGTDLSDPQTIIDDVKKFLGFTPGMAIEAINFYDNLYDRIFSRDEHFIGRPITHVGHSLGGLIANIVYAKRATKTDACITFENPGGDDEVKMVLQMSKGRGNPFEMYQQLSNSCYSYLSHVNAINSCAKQFGNIMYLKEMPYVYDARKIDPLDLLNITSNPLVNMYYLLSYTIADQHRADNIYNYLKAGGLYEESPSHPIGLKAGYLDYLYIEKHSSYWNGYIDYVWDHLPLEAKSRYSKKVDFVEDMYDAIRYAREMCERLPLRQSITPNITFTPQSFSNDSSLIKNANTFFAKKNIENIEDDFVFIEKEKEKPSRCVLM